MGCWWWMTKPIITKTPSRPMVHQELPWFCGGGAASTSWSCSCHTGARGQGRTALSQRGGVSCLLGDSPPGSLIYIYWNLRPAKKIQETQQLMFISWFLSTVILWFCPKNETTRTVTSFGRPDALGTEMGHKDGQSAPWERGLGKRVNHGKIFEAS